MGKKIEEAHALINGRNVASMIREFHDHFRDVYGDDVMASSLCAVGPLQSMIGLAIANERLCLPRTPYYIGKPEGGWRTVESFHEAERTKLRPIAETLAMLDGNAFFGIGRDDEWWADQYLPQAHALYESNGGDTGWAGEASFIRKAKPDAA